MLSSRYATIIAAPAGHHRESLAHTATAAGNALAGHPAAGNAPAERSALAVRCPHQPACPAADRPDREAARAVACHPEQGWSLLCNGVVLFHDTGQLLPDRTAVPPHRSNRSNRSHRRQPAMAA